MEEEEEEVLCGGFYGVVSKVCGGRKEDFVAT